MEIQNNLSENGSLIISDIEGDMGESTRLKMILQPDQDVILSIDKIEDGLKKPGPSIEFCTLSGGGRNPIIARLLRQLMLELAKENK